MTLRDRLIKHEGMPLKPYRDTRNKLTIGVGRNLDDNGISVDEAMLMLTNDIKTATSAVNYLCPWAKDLDDVRFGVLVEMAFNLGPRRLAGFKDFLAALEAGDYSKAAEAGIDSKWAQQVGQRAHTLMNIIREGTDHY